MADRFTPCSVDGCNKNAHTDANGATGYCVMHYARIRRHGSLIAGRTSPGELLRFVSEVALKHIGDDCLPWPFAPADGYGRVKVNGKSIVASRYVCELAHGLAPTDHHQAAHACGNGHHGCVNPHHLSWKTAKENSADRIIHGTHDRGERSANAKITNAQAREIRDMKGSVTLREVSDKFGISQASVSLIQNGIHWAFLSEKT